MLTEREVTPRMAEANRQNSQKSTGPRTPEGKKRVAYNAVKHGFCAQPSMDFMVAVGENPAEYEQIRTGYKKSFHPFTEAQQMLVDDLAMLRWQKRRNQRSQAAHINYEMEQLDINTEELRRQYNRDATNFDRAEVEQKGLINMPDCPAKFEQIRESLGALLDQVERKEFDVDASPTLQLLYGQKPSLRGNFFYSCFGRFLTQQPNAVEYEQLRIALIDEKTEWTENYQTFIRRYVEVSTARRNLCFAPTEAKWRLILRQEGMIDRQIERKTRLLWEMQDRDWERMHDEKWQQFIREESKEEAGEPTDPINGQYLGRTEEQDAPGAAQGATAVEPEQGKAGEQAKTVADRSAREISEQSRQVIENKEPIAEHKLDEQPRGAAGEGSADVPGLGMRHRREGK